MIKNIYIIIGLLMLTVFNCKSSKSIRGSKADFKLSTKQLIKANAKQSPVFKTLQSKVKIDFTDGKKSQSHPVSLRIEKDKIIWLNAGVFGVSLARVKITPSKVSYYSKITNEYFDGDFSLLSDLLGTDLDFQKVQNLLLGEVLYNLNEAPYKVSVHDSSYVLQPKKQKELFEIFFVLDPSYFKVKSQQISQPKELRHLQIDYLSHQDVEKQTLPERIKVVATEATNEVTIDLEFKNVSLNDALRFPFKIPSGFDKIEL